MQQKLTISLLTEAKDGSFGQNEVYTMTRQEAIERMAKAMCLTYSIGDECDCKNCKKWKYQEQKAEAALKAIAPMIPQEDK